MDATPDYHGEEGAEPEGEALDLPVNFPLTHGHELCVVTERMSVWMQEAEMSFLCRLAALSLEDRVKSSEIQRELGGEPMLLHVKKRQFW